MPDGIVVDYQTIHTAADDCKVTGGELRGLFEDLKGRLAPLVDSWQGEAQGAWQAVQAEWDTNLEDLEAVLAKIATALPQIADGYQSTDKAVQGFF
ncbi:type VII secretion protein [Prauserella marina]|uniref:ESAT-6-like protein n=1 Tax=Prauserella marina TaxID=530584 RepID=A0A222VK79_9PSEU|nr:WXG100 family type VII secretion target [Prauserella marina]ASR34121.1 type VII secretion protein [Prauserella marina]PWV82763.1 WXG100 family type VII secretion target [Prauserella marina]SDC76718.1 WXG100 family type VII secretion target [Prauserella marina]